MSIVENFLGTKHGLRFYIEHQYGLGSGKCRQFCIFVSHPRLFCLNFEYSFPPWWYVRYYTSRVLVLSGRIEQCVTFSFLSEGNLCTRKQCTDQYLNNVCNNVKIISPLYTSLKNCFKGDQKLQSCWYNFWCQGSELLQFFWICKHSGGLISRQKEKKKENFISCQGCWYNFWCL